MAASGIQPGLERDVTKFLVLVLAISPEPGKIDCSANAAGLSIHKCKVEGSETVRETFGAFHVDGFLASESHQRYDEFQGWVASSNTVKSSAVSSLDIAPFHVHIDIRKRQQPAADGVVVLIIKGPSETRAYRP